MANDTKERILVAALEMFSQNGYAGTNIRELSASLGLVKSGVYKHFESKEAIWNALLDQMITYYADHFGSAEHLPPVPDSVEELVTMTMQMVNFTVHDEKVIMTRKVLTLEQFRDSRARELATKHFLTGLTDIFTRIFTSMMAKGLLRKDNPEMLAFAYTAPISTLCQNIRGVNVRRRRFCEKIFRKPVLLSAGFDDRRSRDAAIADPVPGFPGR